MTESRDNSLLFALRASASVADIVRAAATRAECRAAANDRAAAKRISEAHVPPLRALRKAHRRSGPPASLAANRLQDEERCSDGRENNGIRAICKAGR